MAKMKKRKLTWKASSSSQVVGYKLYWSENGEVNYDSNYALLGNVTEIVLPDDLDAFTPGGGSIQFGISAIDELGNESDMVTLMAPYQFSVPKAPRDVQMKTLEELHAANFSQGKSDEPGTVNRVKAETSVRLLQPGAKISEAKAVQ